MQFYTSFLLVSFFLGFSHLDIYLDVCTHAPCCICAHAWHHTCSTTSHTSPFLRPHKSKVSEIHYISCRFYFNSIKTFPKKKEKEKKRYLCVFCMFANRRSVRVCVVGSKVGYTFQLINHIKTTYLLSLLLCQLVAHING